MLFCITSRSNEVKEKRVKKTTMQESVIASDY
jgi:hypothetical protein